MGRLKSAEGCEPVGIMNSALVFTRKGDVLASTGITEELERFIRHNITSVEQLEILLLVSSAPDKEWTCLEVSQQLYRQPESIAARADELRRSGLLQIRKSEQGSFYRYAREAASDDLVRALERAYRERKDAVIHLIFSTPNNTLRTFSDAFRIRRND